MTQQTSEGELRRLERRFLDSLRETVEAEVRSRTGIVTRSKQAEANRMSRRMTEAQKDLTMAYMNGYRASTLGIDEAIDTVAEAPHDSAGEEWTDAD